MIIVKPTLFQRIRSFFARWKWGARRVYLFQITRNVLPSNKSTAVRDRAVAAWYDPAKLAAAHKFLIEENERQLRWKKYEDERTNYINCISGTATKPLKPKGNY